MIFTPITYLIRLTRKYLSVLFYHLFDRILVSIFVYILLFSTFTRLNLLQSLLCPHVGLSCQHPLLLFPCPIILCYKLIRFLFDCPLESRSPQSLLISPCQGGFTYVLELFAFNFLISWMLVARCSR